LKQKRWRGWEQGQEKADRGEKATTKWEKGDKKCKGKECQYDKMVGNLTKDWLTENGSGNKNHRSENPRPRAQEVMAGT